MKRDPFFSDASSTPRHPEYAVLLGGGDNPLALAIDFLFLALNWRRFGKPRWTMHTLIFFVVYVLGIFLLCGTLYFQDEKLWLIAAAIGGYLVLYLIHDVIWELQSWAFSYWIQGNILDDYRYDLLKAIRHSVGRWAAILLLITIVMIVIILFYFK